MCHHSERSYRWQTFHPQGLGYSVMTNLALIVDQIKNEISVDATGKGKASIRAVARLMDIDEKALRVAFEGAEQNPSKLAEFLTENGFEGAEQNSWSHTGIPDLAIALPQPNYIPRVIPLNPPENLGISIFTNSYAIL